MRPEIPILLLSLLSVSSIPINNFNLNTFPVSTNKRVVRVYRNKRTNALTENETGVFNNLSNTQFKENIAIFREFDDVNLKETDDENDVNLKETDDENDVNLEENDEQQTENDEDVEETVENQEDIDVDVEEGDKDSEKNVEDFEAQEDTDVEYNSDNDKQSETREDYFVDYDDQKDEQTEYDEDLVDEKVMMGELERELEAQEAQKDELEERKQKINDVAILKNLIKGEIENQMKVEGHINSSDKENDLTHLKNKVDPNHLSELPAISISISNSSRISSSVSTLMPTTIYAPLHSTTTVYPLNNISSAILSNRTIYSTHTPSTTPASLVKQVMEEILSKTKITEATPKTTTTQAINSKAETVNVTTVGTVTVKPTLNAISLTSTSIRLTNKAGESINLHSILVYDGKGKEISAMGTPTMSTVLDAHGLLSLISGSTTGRFAQTLNGTSEWMNIEFTHVDAISKVVINNIASRNVNATRIIGCTLIVTVKDATVFNHTITQANFNARRGNTLTFGAASVRLTNKPKHSLVLHSILVYNGNGKNISASGIPTMSSIHDIHGPLAITSGRISGESSHTLNGPNEWMNIDFPFVDSITKVVLNTNNWSNKGYLIIGSKLAISVGGLITFNHVITHSDYDARIGNAIVFGRSASIRLSSTAWKNLILRSIHMYDGQGNDISAVGSLTVSSISKVNKPSALTSSSQKAHTTNETSTWINIEFPFVDTITKVVLKSRNDSTTNSMIVGSKLEITVGGFTIFNHTITQAEFYARKGNALTFERPASIKLSNKASQYLALHSILVFDGSGREISASGIPTMSSILEVLGPLALISGQTSGQESHTMNGLSEWMKIDFSFVDTISKVVLNTRNTLNTGSWIVGSRLTITLGNFTLFDHVITPADYGARVGSAITFTLARKH